MKEFTFHSFADILTAFQKNEYEITSYANYVKGISKNEKQLILRHDVDRFPNNTLKMAQMEAKLGIFSTYYFRIIPSVFKPEIIQQVAALGHEIGYHYEDLSLCNGDMKKAIENFKSNLEKLRVFYPIITICMHGSPLSKWDNKSIWNNYDYKAFGIIADTSLNVDYNSVFYISDNGRAWNRASVSIRDKVESSFNIPIKNSNHILELVSTQQMPKKVMLNAHPDTFFDPGFKFVLNWIFIESKNIAKWIIVRFKLIK